MATRETQDLSLPPRAQTDAPGSGPVPPPGPAEPGGRRRWLWWLVALLVVAAAATVAVVLLTRDDGAAPGTGSGAGEPGGKDKAREDKAGVGAARSINPGALRTTEGDRLLPPPEGSLEAFDGAKVLGHAVPVESVASRDGFWVGSPEARVFVLVKGGEPDLPISAGVEVTFRARVKALKEGDLPKLGVGSDEGAGLLRRQGHYLKLSGKHIEVEPAA